MCLRAYMGDARIIGVELAQNVFQTHRAAADGGIKPLEVARKP